MDPSDHLDELFRDARMLPPEDWESFLQAQCTDEPTLCAEVLSLLEADLRADAERFLGNPIEPLNLENVSSPLIGRRVGSYTLRRSLGRGGMGEVFLALQEKPFKRYVAIKLVRAGFDTREVLERFDAERQIMASLNHPNIARVVDGGMTDDGQPYLAMEYADGLPLIAHCNELHLGIEDRLRLFQTVCRAVHYAHQNLIIHRDLKPSNILVMKDGTVKLLDFGVAKLLNPSLSAAPMPDTRTALRVMTPEYASPEQVRGLTLTTAADIYSLGILLYELLTGRRPYQFSSSSTEEIVRVVCHEEPVRPSNAATRLDAENAADSANQGGKSYFSTPPERLSRILRGDLDNIV